MRYLFFLAFVLLAVAGTHFYFWTRLVRDTGVVSPFRTWAGVALLLLALGVPLSFLLMRLLSFPVARLVLFPIYVWIGMMLLLSAFFLATDVVRWAWQLVAWLRGHPLSADERLLLGRAQALLVMGAGVLCTVVSFFPAMGRPVVRRLEVTLPGLAPRLDGTRIVQITDLHLGLTLGRPWLEGVVSQVNELDPDLVAITGDLVDGSVERLRSVVEPVRWLRARHGVFFVTGNHEYYSGVGEWMAELPRLGLHVLHNQRVRIGGSDGFDLAGVDDYSAQGMGFPGHGADLRRALEGRQPSAPLVLLAHQPREVQRAAAAGVDLQLSGHTHGGQVWPWTYLVRLQQPAVSGLHRLGPTTLYVSDGTGFWGPPMRLGTRAEITLVILRAPQLP